MVFAEGGRSGPRACQIGGPGLRSLRFVYSPRAIEARPHGDCPSLTLDGRIKKGGSMNYELKSIQPGSVFANAIRIFVVVGFIVAVLSFFILPNPNIRITLWWQKILATFLFTVVYAVVVSAVLTLRARLKIAETILSLARCHGRPPVGGD